MSDHTRPRKESEIQATTDPVPEELESPIAPQGYAPELVEEIADLETPAQKRAKVLRYLLLTVLSVIAAIYFCTPRNAEEELPNPVPIPYGLDERPLPPTDKFLYQLPPATVGDFKRVDRKVIQSFEKPFVGAEIAIATYTNDQGQVATVWIIDAESYINAKRYLKGLKTYLTQEVRAPHVTDYIWQEHNFLEWEAPSLGDRAYGFAWSNQHYYYSVTSPSKEARDFLVQNFPY